jgi:hypothetical protein
VHWQSNSKRKQQKWTLAADTRRPDFHLLLARFPDLSAQNQFKPILTFIYFRKCGNPKNLGVEKSLQQAFSDVNKHNTKTVQQWLRDARI